MGGGSGGSRSRKLHLLDISIRSEDQWHRPSGSLKVVSVASSQGFGGEELGKKIEEMGGEIAKVCKSNGVGRFQIKPVYAVRCE